MVNRDSIEIQPTDNNQGVNVRYQEKEEILAYPSAINTLKIDMDKNHQG